MRVFERLTLCCECFILVGHVVRFEKLGGKMWGGREGAQGYGKKGGGFLWRVVPMNRPAGDRQDFGGK